MAESPPRNPSSSKNLMTTNRVEKDDLLKDVIAYVEVRAEDEDRSDAISHFLQILGASISKYFNRKVTHVVFKNGKQSTYKKATLWGVHLVCVSWIERCKESKSIVPESDYPAIIPEEFTSPFFCGKTKKFKSMVPKMCDVDIIKSLERRTRLREKRRIKRECREFLKMTPTLQAQLKPRVKRLKSDNCDNSITEENQQVTRRIDDENSNDLNEENIGSDENLWNIPLAERLLSKSLTDSFKQTPQNPSNSEVKPQIEKRKLFNSTDENKLNFTLEISNSKPQNNEHTKNTSLNASAPSSSFSDFQLTANKENEVKIHKVIKDFDQDTPPSDTLTEKIGKLTRTKSASTPITLTKTPSLVLTSVRKEESEALKAIVTGVGGFKMIDSVDETTTHVVCGTPRRTLNVLFGLARGCWILSQDWIYKSLENQEWLPECNFELSTEFPGCSDFRLEKRKSSSYRQNTFRELGPMFIGENISIPRKKLQELIILCGGRVVNQSKLAGVLIGCNEIEKEGLFVTEKWILDSISNNKLQAMDNSNI